VSNVCNQSPELINPLHASQHFAVGKSPLSPNYCP
jgi:hypothetical protein